MVGYQIVSPIVDVPRYLNLVYVGRGSNATPRENLHAPAPAKMPRRTVRIGPASTPVKRQVSNGAPVTVSRFESIRDIAWQARDSAYAFVITEKARRCKRGVYHQQMNIFTAALLAFVRRWPLHDD